MRSNEEEEESLALFLFASLPLQFGSRISFLFWILEIPSNLPAWSLFFLFTEEQIMSKDKYPSICSPQMEAIVFSILQIFFATRAVLKTGEYLTIMP